MGKMIPYDFRVRIIQLRESGMTYEAIALEYGFSISGVKGICRRYRKLGPSGLQTSYSNCGKHSLYGQDVRTLIAQIKDGDQGAPYVRSRLQNNYPQLQVPHERTIQRWWRANGEQRGRAAPGRKSEPWTDEAHHTWQIDGKEQIELGQTQQHVVSWINIADEGTGSDLDTHAFPPGDHGSD